MPKKQSAERPIDAIANKVIADAKGVARKLRKNIYGLFGDDIRMSLRSGIFGDGLESIVDSAGEALSNSLYDSQVAAYLQGGSGAIESMRKPLNLNAPRPPVASGAIKSMRKPNVPIPPVAPPPAKSFFYGSGEKPRIEFPVIESAGRDLQQAKVLTPADFYSLSKEMRGNAFTISGDLADGTIEKVRSILSKNFDDVANRPKFLKSVRAEIESLPIGEAHLEQVFRNNVNGAFSDGVEESLNDPVVVDAFPFREYFAIRDDRARVEHLAMERLGLNGTGIYWKDDPVWFLFRPPWSWNCRCGFNPLTIKQAARKGVSGAIEWLDKGNRPADLRVPWPEFRPPESWQRV